MAELKDKWKIFNAKLSWRQVKIFLFKRCIEASAYVQDMLLPTQEGWRGKEISSCCSPSSVREERLPAARCRPGTAGLQALPWLRYGSPNPWLHLQDIAQDTATRGSSVRPQQYGHANELVLPDVWG